MFGSHHRVYTRNRKLLKKDRHKFKSGEKYQVSLEKEKQLLELKHLSDEEFLIYKEELLRRLARERKLFLLKMLLGIFVLGSLVYWLFTAIFL